MLVDREPKEPMHLVDSMAVVRLLATEEMREAVVERATFVLAPVCPIVL